MSSQIGESECMTTGVHSFPKLAGIYCQIDWTKNTTFLIKTHLVCKKICQCQCYRWEKLGYVKK